MSGTVNPSLVSSELTTIETFKDTTEKRGSKLTLNELNYISDKQLHQKVDGEGGGFKFDVLIGMEVYYDEETGSINSNNLRYLEGSYESAVEAYLNEEDLPRFGILNEFNFNRGCFGTLQIQGCEYDEPSGVFRILFTVPYSPSEILYAAVLSPDGQIVIEEYEENQ